jgi:spore coat protein SA
MQRVLVISPGVLPLPPVLGGAVENMIYRLHSAVAQSFEMEYVSVRPPESRLQMTRLLNSAIMHYIDSINPLEDFTFDNQFELHESSRWPGYLDFCISVVRERQPTIVHVHNEAHLLHPLRQACPDARLLLHVNDEVVTRMRPEGLHDLAESCDLILSCSQHIDREIKKAFAAVDVPPPPAEVFYNFVDTQEYDPSAVSPEDLSALRNNLELGDSPVVLFVGRMIEQKGPHLALRAFKDVLKERPDTRLVFVGAPWYSRTNESSFITWMRTEATPISDRIRFTGYVDHRRMPVYYALGDVVCAPSIWDDPSPFVAYEAQAMARPILTSTRGGIPEVVEDRVTGRCIDVFNVKLFSQILIDWINRPEIARQVGDCGRQRVLEQFEISKAEQQLLRIYHRLVSQIDPMLKPASVSL